MLARTVNQWVMVAALGMPLAATVACGGSQKDAVVRANVKPGDMPPGATWTGVYYSQLYGYLHLIKEGNNIEGRWRTTNGDRWGEMAGTVTGDVYRFEWTEHIIGQVGAHADRSGKGYFRYVRPEGKLVVDEIQGEYGLGADEAGNEWKAVKQRNMDPDFSEVVPEESTQDVGGGWDEGNSGPPPSEPEEEDDGTGVDIGE